MNQITEIALIYSHLSCKEISNQEYKMEGIKIDTCTEDGSRKWQLSPRLKRGTFRANYILMPNLEK